MRIDDVDDRTQFQRRSRVAVAAFVVVVIVETTLGRSRRRAGEEPRGTRWLCRGRRRQRRTRRRYRVRFEKGVAGTFALRLGSFGRLLRRFEYKGIFDVVTFVEDAVLTKKNAIDATLEAACRGLSSAVDDADSEAASRRLSRAVNDADSQAASRRLTRDGQMTHIIGEAGGRR